MTSVSMSGPAKPHRLRPEVFIARRRARLERLLQHPLGPPRDSGATPERKRFLREEAEELYWNELEWEKLTAEEMSQGGSELVEFAFPGFLALVDGLLLEKANADSPVPATPRPEVVEEVLLFLATRYLELLAATDSARMLEREMTERLIDLVLYRLHSIPVDGVDRFELARQRRE
ncbi:MAG: hypothetical protein ACREM1_00920, partial [Longimicrobiales bacterium]